MLEVPCVIKNTHNRFQCSLLKFDYLFHQNLENQKGIIAFLKADIKEEIHAVKRKSVGKPLISLFSYH